MNRHILLCTAACVLAIPTLAHAQTGATATQDATAVVANRPAHPAASQPVRVDASQPQPELGEIVVTARRREEALNQVPIAITAFTGQQLEARGVTNVADLVRITPGINISSGGSRVNPFITIRGQSRAVTGNTAPGVLTYFNEVPLPTYGSLIPTYDMDNIQVLKGPQGTLFGRNSIGGAVLAYSRAPTEDLEGYARIDIGSYDFRQFEGALNLPITEGIALRVATQISHDGGSTRTFTYTPYTINGTTASPGTAFANSRNVDEYDNTAFRASLLIQPAHWLRNVTVFDYYRLRGVNNTQFDQFLPGALYTLPQAVLNGAVGPVIAQNLVNLAQCTTNFACNYQQFQTLAHADDRTTYINTDPGLARTIVWGVSNTTTIDITPNLTFKNIFGYRSTDSFQNTDIDGTPMIITQSASQVSLRIIAEEGQLSGKLFNNLINYTAGAFYFKQSPNGPGGFQALEVNALFGLSHFISTNYLSDTSRAIYAQAELNLDSILPGLRATGGVRQTWDQSESCTTNVTYSPFAQAMFLTDAESPIPSEQACRANSLTPAQFPGATSVSAQTFPTVKFKKLTYTLGLSWQITPSALIYVTKRRGYRAGNFNTPLFDPFLTASQIFQPEVLNDWEIGTKIRWRSGGARGSFDIAAFRGTDTGNQFPLPTPNGAGGVCVPQAIGSQGRVANCTTTAAQTAFTPGTPGVTIRLPAATTITNAGDLTIQGFEVAATVTPVPWLTIGGGAAYVDYHVDNLTFDANLLAVLRAIPRSAVPTTIVLQQQPAWTFNGNVTVDVPGTILGGNLSASLDVKHSDSFIQGDSVVKSYFTADARIVLANIGGTGVEAQVYARNLFDENYNYGTAGSSAGAGYLSFIHAQPRTIGLALRYSF